MPDDIPLPGQDMRAIAADNECSMASYKYNRLQEAVGDNLIFVVLGLREFNPDIEVAYLPPITNVFDKKVLGELYGPLFPIFVDVQLFDEPQLIVNSKF
jgi:hypothetical protein